ncbi:hypothetical protein B0H21DRAFT_780408 [Amylocystis lapponica]|nr:hypothetical protein B0H21DRAFT_780408 [Amylocystis lapponica]
MSSVQTPLPSPSERQPFHADEPTVPSHWSARDSRKNLYAPRTLQLTHQPPAKQTKKGEFVQVQQRLRHPQTRLRMRLVNDVSFWVAVFFILGSCAWVANGFLLFLPLVPPSTTSYEVAAAWCAFAGGTLFEAGSYLMVVEALNTGHEQLFGAALWGAAADSDMQEKRSSAQAQNPRFRWIGAGAWRELGWIACAVQMCAATVFWVSTITGLPGVIPRFPLAPPTALADVVFWTPQVVGGTGFAVSSVLLMLETQQAWWRPAPHSLGWHVAGWNLVGAAGFTLCGALGYGALAESGVNYESVLATFWGSWAFLVGSALQLGETLYREDPRAEREGERPQRDA